MRVRTACVAAVLTAAAGTGLPVAASASTGQPEAQEPPRSSMPFVSGEGSTLIVDLVGDSIGAVGITPLDAAGDWETRDGSGTVDSTVDGLSFAAVTDHDGTSVVAEIGQALPFDSVEFDVSLPPGHTLHAEDDDSIAIIDPEGLSTSGFAPPWAIDAEGNQLQTSYSLEGETITQQITTDSETSYPVLADPKLTTGWVTGTIYFNIPETVDIGDATFLAGACSLMLRAGPWGSVPFAACAISWGFYAAVARSARRANKCLKVKFNLVGPPVAVPRSYSGGYCTK